MTIDNDITVTAFLCVGTGKNVDVQRLTNNNKRDVANSIVQSESHQ